MVTRIRNYALIALALFAFHYLLSHHIVFSSLRDFDVLNKTELTLKDTFISAGQSTPEKLLRIDSLREAGYGDLLLDKGMISEDGLDRILGQIEAEEEAELED